jgi:DNA replication and repair protein RecF
VTTLELTDFRCYKAARVELPAGVTVVLGGNGEGKTSLLEAVGWAALGRSFRGVPDAALVRIGAEQSVLRVGVDAGGHEQLVEAEIRAVGRNRILRNRQAVTRTRDLLGTLRVTVFAPDDLDLVKGGPGGRRDYLDDLLSAVAPRLAGVRSDFERVVRQRNALLKAGVRDAGARATLDVFDEQLVTSGAELVRGRLRLGSRLTPLVAGAYADLAGPGAIVETRYEAEWAEGAPPPDAVDELLRAALSARRQREIDRGRTLVGPHRDEWRLVLEGRDTRIHASQGEQRGLALALRLAGHRLTAGVVDDEPVLLLDDVFSELDPARSAALVAHLPGAQTLLTTAGAVPEGVVPARRLRAAGGQVAPA